MRHVVFITSAIPGVRNPNLEFARRLTAAGFRVTFTSPADIEEAVTDRRLPFVRLCRGRVPVPPRASRSARVLRALRIGRRRKAEVDALGLDSALATLESLHPDLILIDLELHPFIIAASGRGLPVAIVSTWLAMWKSRGVPPLHRYVLPRSGWRGTLGVEWAWVRYWVWKAGRLRLDWFRRVGTDQVSVLRFLARRSGFAFSREVDLWAWPLPFSYRLRPIVILNALELDLPHTPPANVRYVGPMIPEPEPASPADPLETFLAGRAAAPRSRPLVYVAFGSFYKGDDTGFIRRVLDAVRDRADWDVVVTLGERVGMDAFDSLPDHIHMFGWVPQTRVISEASAAVVHGGIATINECIAFGVPMVVYPFETNDQMGTAVRVAYHGLGVVGDREADQSDDIRAHVERVLEEEPMRRSVVQLGERFGQYQEGGLAIDVVNELIDAGRGPAPFT